MKKSKVFVLAAILSCFVPGVSLGQRSPTDLADIPLSELLEVRIDSSSGGSDSETASEGQAADIIDSLDSGSPLSLWYRHKQVRFEGYRDGTTKLSNAEVLELYPVLPTVIRQEAHIVGANYRFSNLLDVTLSVPYILQSTDHIRRKGAPFTLDSQDFGDVSLAANYALFKHGHSSAIATLGLTAPTGSIDEKGDTPRGKNTQLPYAMQIGSGSWELHPGITFALPAGNWLIGTTVDGAVRLGKNDRDYKLGDEVAATIWANRKLTSRFQFASYLRGEAWGSIDGQDADVNPRIAPVADPDTYGGYSASIGASLRFLWMESIYDNCFIELGGGIPIWQDLNGPQPEEDWNFTLGISFGF